MQNNRNFFITIILSVLILTLWQVFYMNPRIEAQREAARIEAEQNPASQKPATETANSGAAQSGQTSSQATIPNAPASDQAAVGGSRDQALSANKRVVIDTPSLSGSINLTGARLDDLSLKHYTETVDKNSPKIVLLNPSTLNDGYFAEIGFSGSPEAGTLPGPDTQWSVEGNNTLTQSTPVTLTYTNDKGLTFKRVISVDDNYMFTVDDTVTNTGNAPVSLANYGRVTRFEKPDDRSTYVLHEGLIGVTGSRKSNIPRSRKKSRSRPASPTTAGSASPTNTGRSRSFPPPSSRSSRASASSATAGRATSPTT